MAGTARASHGTVTEDADEVARIAGAYLTSARHDPYRALTAAITDALIDLDEAAVALHERERQISTGYVRTGRSKPASGR